MTTANPLNSARKAIIWREWKKDIPMSVICRLIEKPSATVFPIFATMVALCVCSGSMIPDTNVGGNIAAISEVSDDQETTIFYAGVQAGSRLSGA
jgi:hypothetical protein